MVLKTPNSTKHNLLEAESDFRQTIEDLIDKFRITWSTIYYISRFNWQFRVDLITLELITGKTLSIMTHYT